MPVPLVHDLWQTTRALARQPSFTAVAMLTLALGLGLNSAVSTAAYGILWRPLPFAEPDQLVTVTPRYHEDTRGAGVPPARYDEWRVRIRTVDLAGHGARDHSLRGAGAARVVTTAVVTPNFFEVLGVPAAEGITPRLETGDSRAVVSRRLARTLEVDSGGSPLGAAITVGENPYEVAGVMPASFVFSAVEVDVWVGLPADETTARATRLDLIGRLNPGTTTPQARDDATRVVREVSDDDWRAEVVSLEDALLGDARPAVLAALAASALILFVSVASTVTLILGRFGARAREFAIRSALGAGGGRLARGALLEGLVIAVGGLVVGLFAAWTSLQVFSARATGLIPRASEIGLDLATVLASVGVALGVGLVCGGAAAVATKRRDGAELVRGKTRLVAPGTRRLRAGLVALQLALSIVLMIGAGLLTRSVAELRTEDGGFNPEPVVTARLMLGDERFVDDPSTTDFVNRLLERVRALPTVEAAGLGSLLPPTDAPTTINLRLRNDERDVSLAFSYGAVTSGFFEALGTPLHGGRYFDQQDERAEVADTVVSAAGARFMFQDDEPIGRNLPFGAPRFGIEPGTTTVGVVADMKYAGLESAPTASLYVPWQLRPMGLSNLVVRTSGDPATLVPVLRRLILELDPSLPMPHVQTLEEHVTGSIAGRRLQLQAAGAVAALALLVATVGLFGTLGRMITERSHELSIRAALGASPIDLVSLVLRTSLMIAGVGLTVGLGSGSLTGRGLSSLLYGVSPYDPITFAGVALVVLVATVIASLLPARRAARLNPLLALKNEG